jgi:transcriptional regulator with XRE-family HTH domain
VFSRKSKARPAERTMDEALRDADFSDGAMPKAASPEERQRIIKERQDLLRELRTTLGMSQQDLAVALGNAVVTVARWETSNPPGNLALTAVWKLAHDKGLFDLANRIEKHTVWGLGSPFPLMLAFDLLNRNLHTEEAQAAMRDICPILRRTTEELLKRQQARGDVFAYPGRIATVISQLDTATCPDVSPPAGEDASGAARKGDEEDITA